MLHLSRGLFHENNKDKNNIVSITAPENEKKKGKPDKHQLAIHILQPNNVITDIRFPLN